MEEIILAIGFYKPLSLNDGYFWIYYNFFLINYNFLLLGNFNISHDDKRLKEFCNFFNLGHLIKTLTSYMGANPFSIDHIVTNMTFLFMKLPP